MHWSESKMIYAASGKSPPPSGNQRPAVIGMISESKSMIGKQSPAITGRKFQRLSGFLYSATTPNSARHMDNTAVPLGMRIHIGSSLIVRKPMKLIMGPRMAPTRSTFLPNPPARSPYRFRIPSSPAAKRGMLRKVISPSRSEERRVGKSVDLGGR